jgi:hypothetical protein
MGIVSRKKQKLTPSWQYGVDGQIWRLLPSAQGFLIGEERNASTMSASFFCIDQGSGDVRWEKLQVDEKWWVGLEDMYGNTVFLHGYASPDWPVHKGIIAIDISSGSQRWSNNDVRFLFAMNDAVYAVKETFEELTFVKLDITDGSVLEEIQREQINVLQSDRQNIEIAGVTYPVPGSEPIVERIRSTGVFHPEHPETTVSFLEYLELGNIMIAAYYQNLTTSESTPVYRLSLAVIDQQRNEALYHDVMNIHTSVPHPETFFVMNGIVHYVKEKKVIIAIPLPGR